MKRAIPWFAGAFLVLISLGIRAVYESRLEYQRGEAAQKQGKEEKAVRHYDRSIHWYAPFNPYPLKSIKRLWQFGAMYEEKNPKLALLAYDAIRGSIHAIRSLYWPYRNWLPKVNERIAKLRAQEHLAENPTLDSKKIHAFHKRVLAIDERPHTGWVIFAQIGFWGWLLAVLGWIWKGFDAQGKMYWKPSLPWISGIIVFFSFWILGLVHA